ncbi:hybrid sensor histidine kinase/response regulator transcription factor [Paenibacillus albidus]|uniref:helix-turn-helix transcriptional regulator n=1 Tax=Paenibacillus albidus TaxID=2041023 RepID=UPI001BEBED61|nr:hybrid sensor histidine kinase/response regulator transcription factor [Paenibacillus albidus]MBT2291435.1 hybrid sensor histidine kinase/response regulator transcription factor [Paenibacillus albidus]
MKVLKQQWSWQDWTILTIRILWSASVLLLMYRDQPNFPFSIVLVVLLFCSGVSYVLVPGPYPRYLAVEVLLTGGLCLLFVHQYGLTRLFLPAVFTIAFYSRGKAHYIALPLTMAAYMASAAESVQLSFSHPLIWQIMTDALFVYGVGFALQKGAGAINAIRQKLALTKEQYVILQQYSSQIERMTLLEERYRMAREMHDTIGHSFTSIILGMETMKPHLNSQQGEAKLQGILELARTGLEDIRRQIHQMDPLEEEFPLDRALIQIVEQFQSNTGIRVFFRTMGEPYSVMKQAKHTLYRCLQEALTNASRHGQASSIQVVLQYDPVQVMLQIQDNGRGRAQLQYGFGLTGMQERLASLQGKLYLDSQEEDGTLVTCILPNQAHEGSQQIHILVVDDQPLIRESLRLLLGEEKDFHIRAAGDGQQALEICRADPPDLILMDIHMPVLDGMSATKSIKESWPGIRVIMITTLEDVSYAAEALRLGAEGYLLKSIHPKELAATIRLVNGGGTMISQDVAGHLFQDQQRITLNPYDLTERELDVLQGLSQGHRNKTIAQNLHLSEGTIRNYISSIYLKLQVGSREEAVEKIKKERLIP